LGYAMAGACALTWSAYSVLNRRFGQVPTDTVGGFCAATAVLAAISQCPGGHVDFDVYATGSGLRDAGLVSGGGMTREAALGKLFALLAAGLDHAEVEHWFCHDLCGEMAD